MEQIGRVLEAFQLLKSTGRLEAEEEEEEEEDEGVEGEDWVWWRAESPVEAPTSTKQTADGDAGPGLQPQSPETLERGTKRDIVAAPGKRQTPSRSGVSIKKKQPTPPP
jgi:hypothetical protein